MKGPNKFCISRKLALGVGVPPVWKLYHPDVDATYIIDASRDSRIMEGFGDRLDLTDPQTLYGMAANLDDWEPLDTTWLRSASLYRYKREEWNARFASAFLQHIERIGMDRALRLKLFGGEVEPGTLAEVALDTTLGGWTVDDGTNVSQPFQLPRQPHQHAGLAAIYRKVCT